MSHFKKKVEMFGNYSKVIFKKNYQKTLNNDNFF